MSWIVSTGLKKDIECAEPSSINSLKISWEKYQETFKKLFEALNFYKKAYKFGRKNVVIRIPSFDLLIKNNRQKTVVKHYYIYNLLNFFGSQRFISESNISFNLKQIYFYEKDCVLSSFSLSNNFVSFFKENFNDLFRFNFLSNFICNYNLYFFEKFFLFQSMNLLKLKLNFYNDLISTLNIKLNKNFFKKFVLFVNFENYFEKKLKNYFKDYFKSFFQNNFQKKNIILDMFIIFKFLINNFQNLKQFVYKWSSLKILFDVFLNKKLSLEKNTILTSKELHIVQKKKDHFLNFGTEFFFKMYLKNKVIRFFSYYYDFFINWHLNFFNMKNMFKLKEQQSILKTDLFFDLNIIDNKFKVVNEKFEFLKETLKKNLNKFKFFYLNDYYKLFFETINLLRINYIYLINLNFNNLKEKFLIKKIDYLFTFVVNYIFLLKERKKNLIINETINSNSLNALANFSMFFLGKWFYYRYLSRFTDNKIDYDYVKNNDFSFLLHTENEFKNFLFSNKVKMNLNLKNFYQRSVFSLQLKKKLSKDFFFNRRSVQFLKKINYLKVWNKIFLKKNFFKFNKNLYKQFHFKMKRVDLILKNKFLEKKINFKLFEFKKNFFNQRLFKYNNNFFFNNYGHLKKLLLYKIFFNNLNINNKSLKFDKIFKNKSKVFFQKLSMKNFSDFFIYKDRSKNLKKCQNFYKKMKQYLYNSFSIMNDSLDRKSFINSYLILYKNSKNFELKKKKRSFIFYQ